MPTTVTRSLARLVEEAPGRLWHGYHVSAVDDTKVHRTSEHVWGTCTFHEYTARCPNRATTVRAHNWVVLGALLHNPDQPAWFLPLSGRLYFRKSQLPARSGAAGPHGGVPHQVRTGGRTAPGAGPDHRRGVTWPPSTAASPWRASSGRWSPPRTARPRIEFLTRLRHDARLYAPLPERHRPNQKWGKQAAAAPPGRPVDPGRGSEGHAFLYGRRRKVRWKEVVCLWRVSGHDVPVKAVVAKVEGYKKRFTLVTSAVELTGLQMVELFCCPVPSGGRVPGPEAAAGVGGVPGVDPQPDRADEPGAVGDDEPAAAVAVPAGRRGVHGLVVAAAVEPEEGPAERAGRGAAAAAASGGNPATSCRSGWEMRGKRHEAGVTGGVGC